MEKVSLISVSTQLSEVVLSCCPVWWGLIINVWYSFEGWAMHVLAKQFKLMMFVVCQEGTRTSSTLFGWGMSIIIAVLPSSVFLSCHEPAASLAAALNMLGGSRPDLPTLLATFVYRQRNLPPFAHPCAFTEIECSFCLLFLHIFNVWSELGQVDWESEAKFDLSAPLLGKPTDLANAFFKLSKIYCCIYIFLQLTHFITGCSSLVLDSRTLTVELKLFIWLSHFVLKPWYMSIL